MSLRCACCEGVEPLTPEAVAYRPGLPAFRYRVGTHSSFLETMKARLSSFVLEVPEGEIPSGSFRALEALKTRRPDDAAIALLDGWACVADVLTFYQERIANEGYIRTATERLSVAELANLIGYRLRPGVASSVYLAFTLDPGYEVSIPEGTRAQNVPGPNETMQPFETSEDFDARAEWNNLAPRTGRPQVISVEEAEEVAEIYLKGTGTQLQKGDAILLVLGESGRILRFVEAVEEQPDDDRTQVVLQPLESVTPAELIMAAKQAISEWVATAPAGVNAGAMVNRLKAWRDGLSRPSPAMDAFGRTREQLIERFEELRTEAEASGWGNVRVWADGVLLGLEALGDFGEEGGNGWPKGDMLTKLIADLAILPAQPFRPTPDLSNVFTRTGGGLLRSLTLFEPAVATSIYEAWKRIPTAPQPLEVHALRVTASPFGYNASKQPEYVGNPPKLKKMWEWSDWIRADDEETDLLFLDRQYDEVSKTGYVALVNGDRPKVRAIEEAKSISRTAYGISSTTTRLSLDEAWFDPDEWEGIGFLRETMVYAGSERLETADAPIRDAIGGDTIELADLYDGLESGHAIIISGERTLEDLPEGTGVRVSELALLAGVREGPGRLDPGDESTELPGDLVHTTLILSRPLTYTYKRTTAVVYGNVVKATHGETRSEVLGGGDAARPFQSFTLQQFPVTHVSAATTSGEASTLAVRVNEVLWHPSEGLTELGARDRRYIERQDDAQKTAITFGDGRRGARLPTGFNNVVARLRLGIGKPGNVPRDSISILSSKPLGVRDVINPLAATGGADRDDRDQAKAGISMARLSMGRLVSVKDYEAFSATFAGIEKATAQRLPVGRRFVVHVTIAGADDIPIDPMSDVYANLVSALRAWGDPYQSVQVSVRELMLPVISARIRIDPDHLWEKVDKRIRDALSEELGFARRAIGQSLFASEVVSVMQAVPGVVHVDLDELAALTEEMAIELLSAPATQPDVSEEVGRSPVPVRVLSMEVQEAPPDRGVVQALPPRLDDTGGILAGQLAYVRGDMPASIALSEITS